MPARRARLSSLVPLVPLVPLAALALASCGPAPGALTPTAGPAATASAPVEVVAPPSMAEDAPNVVRCGVDDRPRPVGEEGRGLSAEERSLFGDRAPPEGFSAGARAPRRRPPMPPQPPVPPGLVVRLEQGEPKIGPTPSPGLTSGLSGAAGPEPCEPLAAESDAGPFELEVDLASTVEPLRVRSSRLGVPSPYVRCLMERACQIRARPEAASQRIRLPLRVVVGDEARQAPPGPPQPPEPRPPQLRAEASSTSAQPDRAAMLAERAVERAGASCLRGSEPVDAQLLVRLTIAPGQRSSLDEPVMEESEPRAKRMPAFRDALMITQVANEGPVPQGLMPFMSCVAGQLSGAMLGRVPASDARGRVERVRLRIVRNGP